MTTTSSNKKNTFCTSEELYTMLEKGGDSQSSSAPSNSLKFTWREEADEARSFVIDVSTSLSLVAGGHDSRNKTDDSAKEAAESILLNRIDSSEKIPQQNLLWYCTHHWLHTLTQWLPNLHFWPYTLTALNAYTAGLPFITVNFST